MEIKKDDYYWADSISPDNNCEIHLKRATGSRFVSLIQIYWLNLDIEPVHNYFTALTYMTAYFSKSESEVSELLK